ncbi:hypothetical protein RRG08_038424 [Elysia crispata]|uniref:Uncharacterized protein n=1 Tax=Elysia crispata TaxID=231223 RepID=A0AAE1AMG0_9GAST|nr:hypothetical protein RRG08_038424 [Elysia crispata]
MVLTQPITLPFIKDCEINQESHMRGTREVPSYAAMLRGCWKCSNPNVFRCNSPSGYEMRRRRTKLKFCTTSYPERSPVMCPGREHVRSHPSLALDAAAIRGWRRNQPGADKKTNCSQGNLPPQMFHLVK